ncbi:MAG: hypothetical protein ACP5XB_29445 [Isosphaeraceae bacterium]
MPSFSRVETVLMNVTVGRVAPVLWHHSAFQAERLDLIEGSSGIWHLAAD